MLFDILVIWNTERNESLAPAVVETPQDLRCFSYVQTSEELERKTGAEGSLLHTIVRF